MIRRTGARWTALAVLAAVLSVPGTAVAQDDKPGPSKPTDCPVETVDDKGNVTIVYVPEGTTYGLIHCEGGDWKFGWFPFDSASMATADVITVDDRGGVKVDEAVIDGRAGDIRAGEVKYILEAAGVSDPYEPDQAVVRSEDGKELYTTQELTEKTTIADLADKAGTEAPTVEFSNRKWPKFTITFKCKLLPPWCSIIIRW
ncbi:hypothetical protein ACFY2R_30525 [Micromonospora olivasterospora]|uniref:Uncharacterized protein n=1 Tax=Micromonospora olivasterospora TaxID=1880 RepID=A0A562IIR8_MICOL|nr:hypothetical protein [Micromonospora olivasterospora]TWH70792.1 hypothetical protein JD77_05817 [Micromonospora olivasterospora]